MILIEERINYNNTFINNLSHKLQIIFANLGRPFHLIPVIVILIQEFIQKFNSNQMQEADKLVVSM